MDFKLSTGNLKQKTDFEGKSSNTKISPCSRPKRKNIEKSKINLRSHIHQGRAKKG